MLKTHVPNLLPLIHYCEPYSNTRILSYCHKVISAGRNKLSKNSQSPYVFAEQRFEAATNKERARVNQGL